jgi:hypothetical protein
MVRPLLHCPDAHQVGKVTLQETRGLRRLGLMAPSNGSSTRHHLRRMAPSSAEGKPEAQGTLQSLLREPARTHASQHAVIRACFLDCALQPSSETWQQSLRTISWVSCAPVSWTQATSPLLAALPPPKPRRSAESCAFALQGLLLKTMHCLSLCLTVYLYKILKNKHIIFPACISSSIWYIKIMFADYIHLRFWTVYFIAHCSISLV